MQDFQIFDRYLNLNIELEATNMKVYSRNYILWPSADSKIFMLQLKTSVFTSICTKMYTARTFALTQTPSVYTPLTCIFGSLNSLRLVHVIQQSKQTHSVYRPPPLLKTHPTRCAMI